MKFLILLMGLGVNVHAFDPITFEKEIVLPNIYEASTATFNDDGLYSSHTLARGSVLDWWSVEAVGATTTFVVRYATGIADPLYQDTTSYVVQQSSVINARAGQTLSDDVRYLMFDPEIVIRDLGDGGTAYIRMGYHRRNQ